MSTQANRVSETSAVNDNVSFEIEDATTTNSASAAYPASSVTAPLSGVFSKWCGWWRRPTPASRRASGSDCRYMMKEGASIYERLLPGTAPNLKVAPYILISPLW